MVNSCIVDIDAVTVSDHRLVVTEIDSKLAGEKARDVGRSFPKWNARKVDLDALRSVAILKSWGYEESNFNSAEELVTWINATLKQICNHSMPKNSGRNKKSAYWWNKDLADLRRTVTDSRRVLSRAREKRGEEIIKKRYREYRSSLLKYRIDIKTAKIRAWNELIKELEGGPWGLPYKIVLKKLRPVSPPICETLQYKDILHIVDALFPRREDKVINNYTRFSDWNEDLLVSENELKEAVKKIRGCKKAPGPNGVPGAVLSGKAGAQTFT
ncbi:uncharacterized protein [Linepithema humile]|uniref:uncharacterized protein n=1 Tax=Linepithema humile TaxID=83485 RepID=UPI00351DE556